MSKDLEILDKRVGELREKVREETKKWVKEDEFLFELIELEGRTALEIGRKYGWIDILLLEEKMLKKIPELMKKYNKRVFEYGSYRITLDGDEVKIEEK